MASRSRARRRGGRDSGTNLEEPCWKGIWEGISKAYPARKVNRLSWRLSSVTAILLHNEGLLAFVQSVTCRRKLWAKIFDNAQDPGSTVACCDICVPALLQRTRPAPLTKSSATIKPLAKGLPDESMRALLETWRDTVFERDHRHSPLDSSAILSDDEIIHLSSVGTLTREAVEGMLKSSWLWWNRYGEELMARTEGVEATFTPIPKVPRKPKRSPADEVNEAERAAKKSRTTAVPQVPEISRLTTTPPATAQQLPGGTLATTRVAPPPNMYTGDYFPTEYPYRSQIPVQVQCLGIRHTSSRWQHPSPDTPRIYSITHKRLSHLIRMPLCKVSRTPRDVNPLPEPNLTLTTILPPHSTCNRERTWMYSVTDSAQR
ncbi:hypothetical protein BC629DRAFT_1621220 [Irpex lacteus]|nr:hypothetical protein BC629DRAFT_1621220 [Irpex lacteus]